MTMQDKPSNDRQNTTHDPMPFAANRAPVGSAQYLEDLLKEILASACEGDSETNLSNSQYQRLYAAHAELK